MPAGDDMSSKMVTPRLLNLANFNQHLFMHKSC